MVNLMHPGMQRLCLNMFTVWVEFVIGIHVDMLVLSLLKALQERTGSRQFQHWLAFNLRGPGWRLATGNVHATIKEKADRIITHSWEFCQAVHSSETTMTILEVSPKAMKRGMCQQSGAYLNTAHAMVPRPILNRCATSLFKTCSYDKGL